MNKIFAVVGPTASGKTAFALQLASQALQPPHNYSGVDLISVDSRQVYRGLEILTGADVPENFSEVDSDLPYYKHNDLEIVLHGVSMISVNQEWSVTHFKDFATQIILHAFENNRLPILVGGTGLYHQQLFSSDEKLYVPPNEDVRRTAEKLSVSELSEWLFKVDPEALVQMTDSDVDNPRRLVRAIEKTLWTKRYFAPKSMEENQYKNPLSECEIITFGMQLPLETIQEKIMQRVCERFELGAVAEVKKLERICENSNAPVFSTLGVPEISEFLSGELTQAECQNKWALHEFQYAKRQLTWFRKQESTTWLDELQKKQYTLIK